MKLLITHLLAFFLLCCTFQLQGQEQISFPLHQTMENIIPLEDFTFSFSTSTATNTPTATVPPPVSTLLTAPVPKAYNYEHLGAFCKFEVQLEKAVRLPVKVRLGEVQYTEQLEYGEW